MIRARFKDGETVFDDNGDAYEIRDRIAVLKAHEGVRFQLETEAQRALFHYDNPRERPKRGPVIIDNDE